MGDETPDQRVARLKRELADAKVEALEAQLAEAQVGTADTGDSAFTPTIAFGAQPEWLTKRSAAGPDQGTLAPAPRRVPLAFKLVVLPWSWWTLFAVLMVTTAPIALWITVPLAGAIVAALTFVVIIGLRVRRDRTQLALLKWGEPARVTGADPTSVGTYYSGVTYQNVRLPQAHGWDVERRWYSGPGTTTKIAYDLRGQAGELVLHGLPYDDGVILADSRRPTRALCVSSFPYDLDRDQSGNWVGHVAPRVIVGAVLMIVVLVAWTAAMVIGLGLAAG